MAQEGDAICQEVFSMARATDLNMLLPWCVAMHSSFAIWVKWWPFNRMRTSQQPPLCLSQRVISSGMLKQSSSSNRIFPSSSTSVTRHPFRGHYPLVGPISWVHWWTHPDKAGPLLQWLTWQSSKKEDPCQLPRSWGWKWAPLYPGWWTPTWMGTTGRT